MRYGPNKARGSLLHIISYNDTNNSYYHLSILQLLLLLLLFLLLSLLFLLLFVFWDTTSIYNNIITFIYIYNYVYIQIELWYPSILVNGNIIHVFSFLFSSPKYGIEGFDPSPFFLDGDKDSWLDSHFGVFRCNCEGFPT